MANPDLGEIDCPLGGSTPHQAHVRKYANGRKLYIACARCGMLQPSLQHGQDWILSNARMYGPEGKPADAAAPAPAAPAVPAPAAPAKKESGWRPIIS